MAAWSWVATSSGSCGQLQAQLLLTLLDWRDWLWRQMRTAINRALDRGDQ